MKDMKGRFFKKLKSIPTVTALKTDRIHLLNARPDVLLDLFCPNSGHLFRKPPPALPPLPSKQQLQEDIDVAQLLRDLGEDDSEELASSEDKENIKPIDFYNSNRVFDADLVSAFKQLVADQQKSQEKLATRARHEAAIPIPLLDNEDVTDPLSDFEERCPPGGSYSVILYTTTIRGIRKTFENCRNVRFLLGSLRVLFHERDLSMHSEYREELWRVLGGRVVPPRLFIKGRYIGGADEVLALHEQGKLRPLLADIPVDRFNGMCDECSGVRFVICSDCHGSRKLLGSDEGEAFVTCLSCNENGIVICSLCC